MEENMAIRTAALQAAVALAGRLTAPVEDDDPNGLTPAAKEVLRVAARFEEYIRDGNVYPTFH